MAASSRSFRAWGLRGRVMLMLLLAVTASAGVGWLVALFDMRGRVSEQLRTRANVVVHALQSSIDIALATQLGASDAAQKLIAELIQADEELVYIMILNPQGEAVAWGGRPGMEPSLEDKQGRHALLDASKTAQEQSDGELVRIDQALKLGMQYGAAPSTVDTEDTRISARLLMALTPSVQTARLGRVVGNVALFSGMAVLVLMWFALQNLFQRIAALQRHAANIAQGDLTKHVDDTMNDELGDLGNTLQSVTENLGTTISRVRGVSLSVEKVSHEVRKASLHIESDSTAQVEAVSKTVGAMDGLSREVASVDQEIIEATGAAEVSTTRLREISNAINTVSVSINQLSSAVTQFGMHLQNSSRTFKQVDDAVDRLDRAAAGTSNAMGKIAASAKTVESNTEQALHRSQDTALKAESGVAAVKGIVEGIERIRRFANEAVHSIRELSVKVESIKTILGVIDDIANQTKLLSLNASIIAAQAGEHGRGFLVVADAIKALASKTALSTREISDVINDVLLGSARAIEVVERGAHTVDEGVERSQHADRALSEILAASKHTSSLVVSIATAMTEQSRSARSVEEAMRDVHSTTVGVRDIVAEQREGTARLEDAMESMQTLMTSSLSTAKQQALQTEETLDTLEGIFKRFQGLSKVNQQQMATRDGVVRALETLEELSNRHNDNAKVLALAVEEASMQAQILIRDLQTFKV